MSNDDDEVDRMLSEIDNNDKDIFENDKPEPTPEPVHEPVPEPVKKVKKKRKPLSDERKAQLRENLRKGRETSLKNRKAKATNKKVKKEKLVSTAKGIVEGKYNNELMNQKLMDKITKLENMMIDFNKPKIKPVITPTPVSIKTKPAEISKPIPINKPAINYKDVSTIRLKNFWE
tara:strand:+ start:259 stop:783 length:525 start_codon:yes stop_codon:yes gene_type:complete